MRRVALVVIVGGYAFWGIGSGLGHQPVMAGVGLTAAVRSAGNAIPPPRMKTVEYDGYTVSVPASWPVYNLDKAPRQCVRYDVHAVYLGTPGPDQDCPPHLVGRVDTVSMAGPAAPAGPARKTGGDREGPAPARAAQRALPPGTIVQDPDRHELALAMPDAAPRIDATYGTNPDSVEQILAMVRPAATAQVTRVRTGDLVRPVMHPAVIEATNPAQPKLTGLVPAGKPDGYLAGFDACTAPSLRTMRAWRAKYSAIAIYIGGQMMACGQRNLSAGWVRQAEAMGWSLMPTFVGLQPPCDSFTGKISARRAAFQGSAAAIQAIADANTYGLGPGSPIYYDMEAYDHTRGRCRTAVLTFLDAWTRVMEAIGYVPGVYSSADAAITDLQSTTMIAGHPLARPQAIWFAFWDNTKNMTGAPYLTPAVWPVASRSKQYAASLTVRVGGISLDIDADWVASAVARR